MTDEPQHTDPVEALERVFGPPAHSGFGSAVFRRPAAGDATLEGAARAVYESFVGETWERYGEDAWLGPWREVHRRAAAANGGIVAALEHLADPEAARSAPLLLELPDAAAARAALAAVFDGPEVTDLRVFNIGDGGALSGLLLAARRGQEDVFLAVLMD